MRWKWQKVVRIDEEVEGVLRRLAELELAQPPMTWQPPITATTEWRHDALAPEPHRLPIYQQVL